MKRTARAALRNRDAVAAALADFLPADGTVLELGSGTGEHVLLLAARFPALRWQPSDPDPEARASIAAWAAEAHRPNLLPPLEYDVRARTWRLFRADAVLCVNVLHVAPPDAAEALLAGSADVLPAGGSLFVYAPLLARGVPLAGRLARLDAKLRAHDPALGVRALDTLVGDALRHGLALAADRPMPEEGDRLLVFRRAPSLSV
ncbi:DUF938 domain-containing protein [Anaeromyxobacter oryzae]|uniref:SAM-dependent methyltransferase n=1 Tax=Anaeromyxobacter oryzae TaxID=2918170 RepID=A0ABM7WWN6_9BACT|nr:DUF938 domain-containing protein [Anaeromyxobacter oryzae]BDG03925.1 SAM-dependent methyltransferase [Anaeromyxobacter oryzae]